MNKRVTQKIVNFVYNAVTSGKNEQALARLQQLSPSQQKKVAMLFDKKAFDKLGLDEGANTIVSFARFVGYKDGMKKLGGAEGIAQEICDTVTLNLKNNLDIAKEEVVESLPQTTLCWYKTILKDKWVKIKNGVKNLLKGKAPTIEFKQKNIQTCVNIAKEIPAEYKAIFAGLEGKAGQEFVGNAYKNLVEYLNLKGIAPSVFKIEGADGLGVTGGFDYINNTISYTEGFLKNLTQAEQIKLIAHELKHCEQFSNILRTEGIGIEKYARAVINNCLNDNGLDHIMFQTRYKEAVKLGKGEEFIQQATSDLVGKLQNNFAEILKLPKIKSDSPEGIKALKDFEAMEKYEGLNILGLGSEKYRNNPLEVEAYSFGDSIAEIFQKYTS